MKKLLLPAILIVIVASVLLLRTGPKKVEQTVREGKNEASEMPLAPSKENVTQSFTDHVELLKKKLEENPNDVQTIKMLAQWLMDSHKTEEAITYFERGIRLQPKNDSLLLDLSVCYYQLQQFDKAMTTTEKILQFYPRHPRAMLNKGAIFAARGKEKEAAAIWEQLIQRSPETEEAGQARKFLAQLRKQ